MKNILIVFLFILCFAGIAKSQDQQEILITAGDTTELVYIPANVKQCFITVSDSTLAGVDTIWAYAKTGAAIPLYSPIAVHSLNATALTTYLAQPMIPTNGLTVTYSFDVAYFPGGQIWFSRSNTGASTYPNKTRMNINFK